LDDVRERTKSSNMDRKSSEDLGNPKNIRCVYRILQGGEKQCQKFFVERDEKIILFPETTKPTEGTSRVLDKGLKLMGISKDCRGVTE